MTTANTIMERMGFAPTDCGPYVTQLRASVERQVAQGMTNRSGGTWGPEAYKRDEHGNVVWAITAEERAKELLAWDWAIEQGHYYEVKHIDERRHLGDRWREFLMDLRVWRDRLFGRTNPFTN